MTGVAWYDNKEHDKLYVYIALPNNALEKSSIFLLEPLTTTFLYCFLFSFLIPVSIYVSQKNVFFLFLKGSDVSVRRLGLEVGKLVER